MTKTDTFRQPSGSGEDARAKCATTYTTYSGEAANNPDRDIYASAQNARSRFNYAQHLEYAAELPKCVHRHGRSRRRDREMFRAQARESQPAEPDARCDASKRLPAGNDLAVVSRIFGLEDYSVSARRRVLSPAASSRLCRGFCLAFRLLAIGAEPAGLHTRGFTAAPSAPSARGRHLDPDGTAREGKHLMPAREVLQGSDRSAASPNSATRTSAR